MTKSSTPATLCRITTMASLGQVKEDRGGPMAEREWVVGVLRAANELKVGTRDSWLGHPVTGEGEREASGVRGRGGPIG